MRIDQWLWAVRVFKTRTWAADAIKAGHVTVCGFPCKPAREVRADDIVVARSGEITRTMRVLGSPKSRIGAKLVPQFMEELTRPEEFEKRREPDFVPRFLRKRGAGRPTKKDRRQIEQLG